jgi:hypothetical protein
MTSVVFFLLDKIPGSIIPTIIPTARMMNNKSTSEIGKEKNKK